MNLVTGGNGFLGAYLLRMLLKNGQQVRAIKRATSDLSLVQDIASQIEWVDADVLDVNALHDAMAGVSKIYHLAAIVSFAKSEESKMVRVNVDGTANIVNAALEHHVEKLVHVSSIAALGRKDKVQEISEEAIWENSKYNSAYAISKFRAENEVWRGVAEGLNAVIVNPSVILGAGKWNDTSVKIFKKVNEGITFYPPGITGYVDVRDVAKIIIELMESDISGERFIVSAENLSFKELFSAIARNLDRKPPSIKASKNMVKAAMIFDIIKSSITGTKPTITPNLTRTIGNKYFYDNHKLKKTLDYKFIPVENTIAQTAQCLKIAEVEKKNYGLLPIENFPLF